ncbi:MAG: holo-ACP synthase [Dehalococcoidales bacterium]|nr:holo-ACP synthase [Dehalococcoidales bacterium]
MSDSQLSMGVDIVEIHRVGEALERHGQRFFERVYTPAELRYCRGRLSELAGRFAAKEAVLKALGTGLRGIGWREVEILPDPRGKPLVFLHGRAQARARELGLDNFAISISHSREFAVASVVATGA